MKVMKEIPRSHPRYFSLVTREKISKAMKDGLVHETGLIAHGRGEAFDYLLGEVTIAEADAAERVAAAALLCANNPVISVNGNVAALAADECISLASVVPAKLEVNLFHRTERRMKRVSSELLKRGAKKVYGLKADARIPGLDHSRALCDSDGIFSADVVLVPLEDGDRCQALRDMGKTVIAVDLNPLSRTSKAATITIVDNVIRAILGIVRWVKELRDSDKEDLKDLIRTWDNNKNLCGVMSFISKRLNSLF
ncbi:MAG: 4-phosphopantoate--beta-alanine ligase [Candidatus Thermoplasmatota archaeon]|jgi:4-phosphopantoate--beta-alanine ligase|nr:4-phosphopantoate--beta-alanine ligase [Candidatus Thermoplasmatota archaeon]